MTDLASKFDKGTAKYQDYGAAPWGRLRIEMIWRQLQRHIPTFGLRVLDAGCGLGELAIRLAQAGHSVTALDFSAEMLTVARDRGQTAGVEVDWRQVSVREAANALAPAQFDLILCHSVLSYLDHPAAAVRDLATLLKPNGTWSLLGSNPKMRVLHTAIWQRDFAAALDQLQHPTQSSGTFGLDLELHSVETLAAWFQPAGLEIMAHYGVRVVNDFITNNDIKYNPEQFAALLQLEMALCQQSPYRDIAAFYHLVASKIESSL